MLWTSQETLLFVDWLVSILNFVRKWVFQAKFFRVCCQVLNLWISEELIVVMFSCLTLLLALARGFPVHCILSLHFDLLVFFLRWLSLSSWTVIGRMFSFICFRILPHMIYMIVKWRSPYLSNFKEFYLTIRLWARDFYRVITIPR